MSDNARNQRQPQPIRKGTGYPVSLDKKPPAPSPSVKGNAMYPTSIDKGGLPKASTTTTPPSQTPPKAKK